MKKLVIFSLLVLAAVSCGKEVPRLVNRAAAIAEQIHNPNSKYVVVAVHRGDWRNFPENSIPAIESTIALGADMVEIDIHMTADSVLVLCHDDNVKRTTNFSRVFREQKDKSPKIKDLTLEEIKSLSLKREHGIAIDTLRMPTLREALLCTKDRICVNIDKGWDYFEKVLEITEELGVTEQVLIKGSKPLSEVSEHLAAAGNRMMYMPIVNIQKEKGQALLQSYLDSGTVPLAYEVCWSSNDDGAFDSACKKIIGQGSKVWVNTIWASLCGGDGNDDDEAFIRKDPGEVYRQYLDKGVSMFQTDRPALLIPWLEKHGRHKL